MKDLITAIGSVIILMVFCMQFCSNQVIAMRIFAADSVLGNTKVEAGNIEETGGAEGLISAEEAVAIKKSIAGCLGCDEEQVVLSKKDENYLVEAPVTNVIACGEFLGISAEENKFTYQGVVRIYEESDNNNGDFDTDDNAQ